MNRAPRTDDGRCPGTGQSRTKKWVGRQHTSPPIGFDRIKPSGTSRRFPAPWRSSRQLPEPSAISATSNECVHHGSRILYILKKDDIISNSMLCGLFLPQFTMNQCRVTCCTIQSKYLDKRTPTIRLKNRQNGIKTGMIPTRRFNRQTNRMQTKMQNNNTISFPRRMSASSPG